LSVRRNFVKVGIILLKHLKYLAVFT